MPPLLSARPPADPDEQRTIRRLAASRHAPGDWILRARIVGRSWDGQRVAEIATALGCHPKTVRQWLHSFNAHGVGGLGDLPRSGRPRRLGEPERGQLIALVRQAPPGRLVRQADGALAAEDEQQPAQWTLDALVQAAHELGIAVGRSQIRRILLAEGARWRWTRSWTSSSDPEFVPKKTQVIALYTSPPAGVTVVRADELGPVLPRTFPPAPGWSADGHRVKAPLEYSLGIEKTWVYGGLRVADGQAVTLTAPSRNSANYQRFLVSAITENRGR